MVQQLKGAHPKLEADIARRLLIACEDPEERVKNIAVEYVFSISHQQKTKYGHNLDYGLKRNYPSNRKMLKIFSKTSLIPKPACVKLLLVPYQNYWKQPILN